MNKNRKILSSILICMLAHTSTFGYEELSSHEQNHQSSNQKLIVDKNKDENKRTRIKRGLITLSLLSFLGVPTYYLGRKIYKYDQWANDKRLTPYVKKDRLYETSEETLDYLFDEMEKIKMRCHPVEEPCYLPITILNIFDFMPVFNCMRASDKVSIFIILNNNDASILCTMEGLDYDASKCSEKSEKFGNHLVTYRIDNRVKSKKLYSLCEFVCHRLSDVFKNEKKFELLRLIGSFKIILNKNDKKIIFRNNEKESPEVSILIN